MTPIQPVEVVAKGSGRALWLCYLHGVMFGLGLGIVAGASLFYLYVYTELQCTYKAAKKEVKK